MSSGLDHGCFATPPRSSVATAPIRWSVSALTAWSCLASLTACHDPFRDDPLTIPDRGEQLRVIEPAALDEYDRAINGADGANFGGDDGLRDGPAIEPPAERSLTLAECRALALEHNLDLAVQLISPSIAAASVSESEARFEALLFGSGSYSDSESPTATTLEGGEVQSLRGNLGVRLPLRTGGTLTGDFSGSRFETDNAFSTLNPSFDSDATLSLSQPLLRGAGVWVNTAPIQISRLDAQAVNARTRLEVIRALTEIDRVYWRLYATREALEVRRQQHELAIAQFDRARRNVNAGVGAEIDVIRAEAGVAQGLEAIIRAENAARQAERDLKRLLNAPGLEMEGPTRLITDTPANPVAYDLDRPRLLTDAMNQRMEMLELELQLATDALNIGLARNASLPLATVDYRYTRSGLGSNFGRATDQLYEERFDGHTVSLNLEVPLGNEAARNALERALLGRLQRLATKRQRVAQIKQEVLDAADALETAWQRVLAARQSTLLEARVLEAEERQFDQGLNTSTDVLDAQTRLADAQSSEIAALVDYQVAQIDLAFATGTVLGSAQVRWAPRRE